MVAMDAATTEDPMTHLIPRQTITQLVNERDAIIAEAMDVTRRSSALQQRLGRVGRGVIDAALISTHRMDLDSEVKDAERRITQDVDRAMWSHVLQASGIRERLSPAKLAGFEATIQRDPPAITEELLVGTLLTLTAQAGEMLEESVTELWRMLSHDFKTNAKAPFPAKWIIDISTGYAGAQTLVHRRLHEIDRIIAQLDGAPAPIEYQEGLSGLVYRRRGFDTWADETPYWTIKRHKNGRAHLTTKRPDLIDKLNTIIIQRGQYLP